MVGPVQQGSFPLPPQESDTRKLSQDLQKAIDQVIAMLQQLPQKMSEEHTNAAHSSLHKLKEITENALKLGGG